MRINTPYIFIIWYYNFYNFLLNYTADQKMWNFIKPMNIKLWINKLINYRSYNTNYLYINNVFIIILFLWSKIFFIDEKKDTLFQNNFELETSGKLSLYNLLYRSTFWTTLTILRKYTWSNFLWIWPNVQWYLTFFFLTLKFYSLCKWEQSNIIIITGCHVLTNNKQNSFITF